MAEPDQTADRQAEIEKTLGLGRHRRRVPLWLRWALGLVALILVVLLRLGQGGAPAVSYTTEVVTRGPLSVTVSATGTVEPTNLVEVSSELSGTLAEVEVDYNDAVEPGQVLARLDTTKLEAQVEVQRSALLAAEAVVEQAQVTLYESFDEFERQSALDERGVTTHAVFTAAEAALKRAEAALQIADADRALADAQLALQQADLDKAVITAPIRGVILERNADVGQIVASSLSAPVLFTIAEDLRQMELQVEIDEADIGLIAVGNRATFTVEAYDDDIFPAEILTIRYAPETVEGVVSYKAILGIDNAALKLRPGMTATAEIVVADLDDVLTVPNAALRYVPPQLPATEAVEDAEGSSGSGLLGLIMPDHGPGEMTAAQAARSVWVLRDGAPVEVAVETGQSDGQRTVVLTDALRPGDRVITDQREAR